MAHQDADTVAANQSLGQSTLEGTSFKAEEDFNKPTHFTLNIAVTGETGTGKSSFVNAIIGLSDDDDGAAKIGPTETTKEPTMYPHPTMPNVRIWDLPGFRSQNFKAKEYIKKIRLNFYDFFIIIVSERFKENHFILAKEIQKQKKMFYFVRSKIDNDVRSQMWKKGFNEQDMALKIREDCETNLKELGSPKVFLISALEINKYDFQLLKNTMENELPAIKRYALLQAWPMCSKQNFNRKVEIFQRLIWVAAFLSGGTAVIRNRGVSSAFVGSTVVTFFTCFYHAFGLDDGSLERLSKLTNKDLKPLRKSLLVSACGTVLSIPIKISALAAVEHLSSLASGLSMVLAAGLSFGITKWILNEALSAFVKSAKEIMKEAGLE